MRSPMPAELWTAATDLARGLGSCPVARELRIGYEGLRDRLGAGEERGEPAAAAFVAVDGAAPLATGHSIHDRRRLQRRYGKGHWRKRKGIARVKLLDRAVHTAEVHWYEATWRRASGIRAQVALDRLNMEKRGMRETGFAVCIDTRGYEASLENVKLYWLLPDREAEAHGYVRVIDESGEDYGYAAERFFPLSIPAALARALRSTRTGRRPARRRPRGARAHGREVSLSQGGLPV